MWEPDWNQPERLHRTRLEPLLPSRASWFCPRQRVATRRYASALALVPLPRRRICLRDHRRPCLSPRVTRKHQRHLPRVGARCALPLLAALSHVPPQPVVPLRRTHRT